MASSKKKQKSPKKPVAKKKAAPKAKAKAKPAKAKAKAKPFAKKQVAAKKPAAKKPTPKKAKAAAAPEPTHGDAWGNAALAPKVAEITPKTTITEPPGTPALALHDHEGELVSPVEESEELAERIHGGEEAVKDEDADDDTGSPVVDDRDDDGE